MNIHLLGDRVIVKPAEEETVSAGGIMLVASAREKIKSGKVLAVGPLVGNVAVGHNVLFGKYSGTPVLIEDQDVLILRESDLVAITGVDA